VANALFKLFMRMGIPRVITTDQGSEFNNQLNKQLMSVLEIDHRLTTTYHPQVSPAKYHIYIIIRACINVIHLNYVTMHI